MAAGPITDDMKWCANPRDYIAVEYQDTYLVYVKPSGETHFLNFLSYGVITEAVDAPQNAEELTEKLRMRFELTADELTMDLVRVTLSELDDTGLIYPCEQAA